MNFQAKLLRTALFSFALMLLSFTVTNAQDSEFSFKVTNKTKVTIKRLLVAEPNKKYKDFDIGKGIRPGETATLIWNKATDNEQCEQWFKAVYADGVESEAAYVDFCEDDVHLDFNP
jgi:hypothetical protein